MKKKIFYIEDEPFLGKIVKETLESRNYEVLLKEDGAQAINVLNTYVPDICILDVMLPHVDGFTLGSHIRAMYPKLPIIFLTAKVQTEDVVKGFASGGTDFIKKPFSMEELIVRIENQFQLAGQGVTSKLQLTESVKIGNYLFIPSKLELQYKNQVIKLSHRESQLLTILSSHCNGVIDRKELLLLIWGDDSFFNSRTLDVYVRKLREYFTNDSGIEIITLKGKGYHFIVPGN